MAVYNLAVLLRFASGRVLDEGKDKGGSLGPFYITLGICWTLCLVIYLLAFNLGNLYFGFHYFKCSTEIGFL
jgi:hypothetical protein